MAILRLFKKIKKAIKKAKAGANPKKKLKSLKKKPLKRKPVNPNLLFLHGHVWLK